MEKHFALLDNRSDKYKKHIFGVAGAGFFLGVLFSNTFGRKMLLNIGVFGDYFFMQVENVIIDSSAVFLRVFEKRMLFVMVLVVAAVVSQGVIVVYGIAGWLGMSMGMLLSSAAMQKGIEGILMCLFGVLPHFLLYIPAGLLLMVKSCEISGKLYGKEQRHSYNIKRELSQYIWKIIVISLLFFAGILLESFLNPIFLQKIYRIFNNI